MLRKTVVNPDLHYPVMIERGHTPVNDAIVEFLKPRVCAPYLDIGCNVGALLEAVPGGTGVDASVNQVQVAIGKGLRVRHAWAEALPYNDQKFATAVLSCILEQCGDWRSVLAEARRVAGRVIGINPYPGKSPWGSVQGWVKSVIAPEELIALGAKIEQVDEQRYYFELS